MNTTKLTFDQISEAKREVTDIVQQRYNKTNAVQATSQFTVVFSDTGEMTILNGNCHELVTERCIEFDVTYRSGFVDIRQNRFYNIGV